MLSQIDRIYGWEATPDNAFRDSLAKQKASVVCEFEHRVEQTKVAFAEQGLNAKLYYENKNFARNVSLVPTSAITDEGTIYPIAMAVTQLDYIFCKDQTRSALIRALLYKVKIAYEQLIYATGMGTVFIQFMQGGPRPKLSFLCLQNQERS